MPASRSMRREISIVSYSLYGAGRVRSELSMNSVTSAMLRDGRPALPAKITSSISLPRTEVGRVSPITQRSASNRLDLPQPFGPTTAVRPGSMKSSVGSTKDLKPESLSRCEFQRMRRLAAVDGATHFLASIGIKDLLAGRPDSPNGRATAR